MLSRLECYLRSLGPGIVTGASDSDPAGISTYSIAGASNANTWAYNFLGWLTVVIMTLADVAAVWMLVR